MAILVAMQQATNSRCGMVRPCLGNQGLVATMPCVTPDGCDTMVNAAATTPRALMNVILSGDLDSHLAHLVARSEGNCSSQPIFRLQ